MTVTSGPMVSAANRLPDPPRDDGPSNLDGDVLVGPSRWKGRLVLLIQQALLLVALLLVWAWASGRWVDEFYISSPAAVFNQLKVWIQDGTLWSNAIVTLQETVWGFLLGASAGAVVGCVLGLMRRTASVVNPFILAVNTIPKLAVAPMLILWFGIGLQMKVVLAALLVFFLVFYNTYTGVRDVDKSLVNVVLVMGAGRWQLFRHVIAPSAAALIFAGLRVSVPYAFLGAVVGEMLAASRGLGVLITRSSSLFNPAGVFAALIVLVVLSAALNGVVAAIEAYLLRWRKAGDS